MAKENYIQIGVTALRTPTGDFLPSVPLYVKTTEAVKASGFTASEEGVIHSVAQLFALKHIETTANKEVRNVKV